MVFRNEQIHKRMQPNSGSEWERSKVLRLKPNLPAEYPKLCKKHGINEDKESLKIRGTKFIIITDENDDIDKIKNFTNLYFQ